MFDFVDNQSLRIILELVAILISGIFGFLGGMKYSKKSNRIGNIKNSTIKDINQRNK